MSCRKSTVWTGVVVALLLAGSTAWADFTIGSVSASVNVSLDSRTSATHLIDQTGLSANYVSGVTDFSAFASTATHTGALAEIMRTSVSTAFPVVVTFDLGPSAPSINGLALWQNSFGSARFESVQDFELFADTDGNIGNGGTTSLGTYRANMRSSFPEPSQSFSFAATGTRFVHMQITSNYGSAEGRLGLGEVVFSSSIPIPVPGAALLGMMGLGMVGWVRRRIA